MGFQVKYEQGFTLHIGCDDGLCRVTDRKGVPHCTGRQEAVEEWLKWHKIYPDRVTCPKEEQTDERP